MKGYLKFLCIFVFCYFSPIWAQIGLPEDDLLIIKAESYQDYVKQQKFRFLNGFVASIALHYKDVKEQFDAINRLNGIDSKTIELKKLETKLLNLSKTQGDAKAAFVAQQHTKYKNAFPILTQVQYSNKKVQIEAYVQSVIAKRESEYTDALQRQLNEQSVQSAKDKLQGKYGKIYSGNIGGLARYSSDLYDSQNRKLLIVFQDVSKYLSQLEPQKDQFESQEQFQKRVSTFFEDSTDIYFRNAFKLFYEKVKEHYVSLTLRNYDAEKGVYSVEAGLVSTSCGEGNCSRDIEEYTGDFGLMLMPNEKARTWSNLIDRDFTQAQGAVISDFLFGFDKYQLKIKSVKLNGYNVEFSQNSGVEEFKFYGNELWPNNPYAKNLVVGVSDILKAENAVIEKKKEEELAKIELAKKADNVSESLSQLVVVMADGSKFQISTGDTQKSAKAVVKAIFDASTNYRTSLAMSGNSELLNAPYVFANKEYIYVYENNGSEYAIPVFEVVFDKSLVVNIKRISKFNPKWFSYFEMTPAKAL